MSDEQPPNEPPSSPGADARDEHVAALLDVPPLDEVTRRRLVTRAVARSGLRRVRGRRVRFPAAAALVVLLIVGVGALVLAARSGDDGNTATRSTPAAPKTAADAPTAGEADASVAGVPDLGDLGDLTDEGELRRRLRLAERDPAPAPRAVAPACLERAVAGSPAPDAFATGVHEGRPVLVLVLPSSGDSSTAVLLEQQTCRAVSIVSLP
jgi:hypothetical protein